MSITIQAVKCPKCEDIIFSRAGHDYHSCSCGTLSVDGGFEYMKLSLAPPFNFSEITELTLELNLSKRDLYDDWNKSFDKHGVIKKGSPLWK